MNENHLSRSFLRRRNATLTDEADLKMKEIDRSSRLRTRLVHRVQSTQCARIRFQETTRRRCLSWDRLFNMEPPFDMRPMHLSCTSVRRSVNDATVLLKDELFKLLHRTESILLALDTLTTRAHHGAHLESFQGVLESMQILRRSEALLQDVKILSNIVPQIPVSPRSLLKTSSLSPSYMSTSTLESPRSLSTLSTLSPRSMPTPYVSPRYASTASQSLSARLLLSKLRWKPGGALKRLRSFVCARRQLVNTQGLVQSCAAKTEIVESCLTAQTDEQSA